MSATAVRVRDLQVTLGGTTVLDGIDLEVGQGELVALLGPSGCGKTTLLRVVAGLQAADSGVVELAGTDVSDVPTRRRRIGMVFQHYGLFPTMTARDNVAFPLRSGGADPDGKRVGGAQMHRRVDELLELVGMSDFAGQRPSELSGGQQQRVALARALAAEPRVLLLDEPLSALDAVIRDSLRDEIRALQQRLDLAVLHVTHDQSEAMAMADRIAVMHDGRIVEQGPPEQLYSRPRAVFTARFIGGRNEVATTLEHGTLRWGDALALPGAPADAVAALFPPESVQVSAAGDGAHAMVLLSSFQGSTVRLHLDVSGTTVIAEVPASETARFAPGTDCRVRVDPGAVTVVPRPPTSASKIPGSTE
jgi:putative spermidine/putrescine transport system ATP-binding protein